MMKVSVLLLPAAMLLGPQIQHPSPALNKQDTRAVLEQVEKEMAADRKANPPQRSSDPRSPDTMRVVARNNSALVGKICTFRVVLNYSIPLKPRHSKKAKHSAGKFPPPRNLKTQTYDQSRESGMIEGTSAATVNLRFGLRDIYPERMTEVGNIMQTILSEHKKAKPDWGKIKQLRARSQEIFDQFSDELIDVRHQIQVRLPQGSTMPPRPHYRPDAPYWAWDIVCKIVKVGWDRNARIPHLVIYADFVESEDITLTQVNGKQQRRTAGKRSGLSENRK